MSYIEVHNLYKRFKKLEAVRGVSFTIEKGEIYGFLGPNGAGKSTTISMLAGILKPTGGEIKIAGYSMMKQPMEVKRRIGLVPQDIALYPKLSARENLNFWGRMYSIPQPDLSRKVDEVLQLVGLTQRANEPVKNYSGGMKRRINIAAGVLHQPEVLILDEPTVGVDPQSRNHIFEFIKQLNQSGTTIIYTSHYMEEVEHLCRTVTIIDGGDVVAAGTKEQLLQTIGEKQELIITSAFINDELLTQVRSTLRDRQMSAENDQIKILTDDADQILTSILSSYIATGIAVSKIEIKKPNLESLFMKITGRTLRE
jgi:ABC-2 type transport system ATP-binding protein